MIHKIISGKDNTTQALWVALGNFSHFSLSVVSAVILSRYLDKDSYGTYRQIIYVYMTLQTVFSVGIPNAFAYFLPRYSLQEGSYIVKKLTHVLFLLGLAFSVLLFIFSDLIAVVLKNSELAVGLKYFSAIPVLILPTMGMEGLFSTYRRTIWLAIYNTLTRLISLLCIVSPVIILGSDYRYAVFGWILASVLGLVLALYFKRIPFRGVSAQKAALKLKTVFAYCLPLLYANFAGIAISSADQFFISRYFGVKAFAEFSNGFQQIPFVPMITGAAATVLMPVFSKLQHHNATTDEVLNYWSGAMRKSAILIYPMVIFFIFYATDIVVFLYSGEYEASGLYFQISMLANFFTIVVFAPLIFAFGKTKEYAGAHVAYAIFIWIVEYFAVKLFRDPYWIAAISIGGKISLIIYFLWFSASILNVRMSKMIPFETILRLLLHGFFAASISYVITNSLQWSIFSELLLGGTIYSAILLLTGSVFKLNYLEFILPILRGRQI